MEPIEASDVTPSPSMAEAPSAPRVTRMGVVLLPRGATDPSVSDSLTELLIARVASRGAMEIVGKEEFQAALGRDDAGTLDCIESDACLGRMGRELRVSELITGTIHIGATDAERIRFELYRLDVASGSARGHVSREIEGGLPSLLGALNTSVDELFVERIDPGAVVLTLTPSHAVVTLDEFPVLGAEGRFRSDFLSPGDHTLVARASGFRTQQRIVHVEPGTTLMLDMDLTERVSERALSPLTWTLGATSVVGFGFALGLGVASSARPETLAGQPPLTMSQSNLYFTARADEALAANILFGVSAALAIATVVTSILDLTIEEADIVEQAMRGEVATW